MLITNRTSVAMLSSARTSLLVVVATVQHCFGQLTTTTTTTTTLATTTEAPEPRVKVITLLS